MEGMNVLFSGFLLAVTGVICLVITDIITHNINIYSYISLSVFGVGGIITAVGMLKVGKEMGWA